MKKQQRAPFLVVDYHHFPWQHLAAPPEQIQRSIELLFHPA
ncbi:hypothetical protein BVRB_6g155540 [Beta vulgaris subsp. vulgaris]|uniref:Uncharacterized protein n=1 Tax=Beta vulgaris subsp. vulgaris TaxID=3555 RepID=A0A0J8B7Z0_BETVV|nr:hypothetical protein BVRB_6g155540 [Beta vulgaris subsp. vulgaris]